MHINVGRKCEDVKLLYCGGGGGAGVFVSRDTLWLSAGGTGCFLKHLPYDWLREFVNNEDF